MLSQPPSRKYPSSHADNQAMGMITPAWSIAGVDDGCLAIVVQSSTTDPAGRLNIVVLISPMLWRQGSNWCSPPMSAPDAGAAADRYGLR
jgi:hypothetical protein